MRNDKYSKCSNCGGELEMVSRTGTIETLLCKKCGKKENVHFSISPDELYSLQDNTVEICIDWCDKYSNSKTIMKIRSLVPELKKLSLNDLNAKLCVGGLFSLGRYYPDQADELKGKLEDIGINVRFVD